MAKKRKNDYMFQQKLKAEQKKVLSENSTAARKSQHSSLHKQNQSLVLLAKNSLAQTKPITHLACLLSEGRTSVWPWKKTQTCKIKAYARSVPNAHFVLRSL